MNIRGWLLAGSLLLNATLVAYISTGKLRSPSSPIVSDTGSFAELRSIAEMPPSARGAARSAIRLRLPELRANRQDTAARFAEFQASLRQVPFDRAEINAAADALADARREQWRLAADVFLDVLESLPEAERRVLLERREETTQEFRQRRRERIERDPASEDGDR